MSTNRDIELPDRWTTNADTEKHLSLVNTSGDHVLILTPTPSVTDKWRVKGLQGFDTDADYPTFATGVSESEAAKTAVEVMEAIVTEGRVEDIETVETGRDNTVETESDPGSEDSEDNDGQADLTSFM